MNAVHYAFHCWCHFDKSLKSRPMNEFYEFIGHLHRKRWAWRKNKKRPNERVSYFGNYSSQHTIRNLFFFCHFKNNHFILLLKSLSWNDMCQWLHALFIICILSAEFSIVFPFQLDSLALFGVGFNVVLFSVLSSFVYFVLSFPSKLYLIQCWK